MNNVIRFIIILTLLSVRPPALHRCERSVRSQVLEDSEWHEEVSVAQAGTEHLDQSNSFLMSSQPYAALIKRSGFSIN